MERHLSSLNLLSLIFFIMAFAWLVPTAEWIPALAYLAFLVLIAKFLYEQVLKPHDPTFSPALFFLAFMVKMLGGVSRYWMVLDIYGRGDALRYHWEGQELATSFTQLDFSVLGETFRLGTAMMSILTGLLYSLLPVSLFGIFLLFAVLAFAGSVLCYCGFRLAFPQTNPHLYRILMFFLPSVFFWPSSLGKDAWIFFGSGFVAYGLVKFTRLNQLSGLFTLGIGLALIGLIRPHISAFMMLSLAVAYLPFLFRSARNPQHLLSWLVGGSIAVVMGVYVLQSGAEFLQARGLEELTETGIEEYYYQRQRSTFGGGSRFAPTVVLGVAGIIGAPVIVLLRPFPWEAHNPQAMITAMESMFWLGIFFYRGKVFLQRLRTIAVDPLVAFSFVYSFIMIVSLTTIGNYGLLARQRVSLLPFLWMLFG
jgi:hypothetical protein